MHITFMRLSTLTNVISCVFSPMLIMLTINEVFDIYIARLQHKEVTYVFRALKYKHTYNTYKIITVLTTTI